MVARPEHTHAVRFDATDLWPDDDPTIETLLIDKGVLTEAIVDKIASIYEHDIGPMRGARVVARAWCDEDFKRRWNSSSEVRHMVVPRRPAGAAGLSEEELAGLVTRDAMIGAGLVSA